MEIIKNATSKLRVHVILWFIAAFMLVIGIMNLQGSFINKDYRCLDGKIVDVEETQVLKKQGIVTRYNYKIAWYDDDDILHKKSMYEAVERPDESMVKVWVNSDNTDAFLGDPSNGKDSAYVDLSIAIIVFILGMIFVPRKNKKRKMSIDKMESIYCQAILMAVLMAFSDMFMIFLYHRTTDSSLHATTVLWDLAVIFNIVLVISIVIIVKLRRKLK